jgi:hypothetical protein
VSALWVAGRIVSLSRARGSSSVPLESRTAPSVLGRNCGVLAGRNERVARGAQLHGALPVDPMPEVAAFFHRAFGDDIHHARHCLRASPRQRKVSRPFSHSRIDARPPL